MNKTLESIITEEVDKALLDESFYHGTSKDFEQLKLNGRGILWLAYDQNTSGLYAQGHDHGKTGIRNIWTVELVPNAKIVDLRDLNHPFTKDVYQSLKETTWRSNGFGPVSPENWYQSYADFGLIEYHEWIIKYAKRKRIQGLVVNDSHNSHKHLSVALLTLKAIQSTEKVDATGQKFKTGQQS